MTPLHAKSPLVVCLSLLAAVLVCGCQKKPVAPPPQAQAPAPSETPAPSSETTPPTQATSPATQGTPPPDPGQAQPTEGKAEAQPETQAADETTDKSQTKPARSRTKKSPPSTTARSVPPKIVVKPDTTQPSATPGQISPGSSGDVSHNQASTEQLLQSSESNLNGIKRQLSSDEQAIVAQIRDYITQSRQAIKENDLGRARNLALKAHLLSDDLAKKR